jgi:hypothetical protein
MSTRCTFCLIATLLAATRLAAAAEPPAWTVDGPRVDADRFALELPLEVLATKLFVEIELGGKSRRFVFDTGSPSMMSAALAAELGLEPIDHRQGRDSHGAVIDTAIVQSDLTLGDVTFRKVPIFVATFPEPARCLFDGVLGSELLPLCAWQIDLPDRMLRCASDPAALDHVASARRMPLHDFGYPHAPILDVRFAKRASSKALFDTGSPEYLAISPADLDGARRNGAVGEVITGSGSLGGSLGGQAARREQQLVQLKSLQVGTLALGRVAAPLRESSPSLVGASMLEHFVVTLDTRSATAWFDPYRPGPYQRTSFGFGLGFDDGVAVSLVWNGSPAEAAGVQVGRRLTSIDGQPIAGSCDGIRTAMQAMSQQRDTIELGWQGGGANLTRRPPFDQE